MDLVTSSFAMLLLLLSLRGLLSKVNFVLLLIKVVLVKMIVAVRFKFTLKETG